MQVAELFATLGLRPDTSSWEKGSKLIGGVKTALGGLVAAAAVWKGVHMVEDVIDLGGHLHDTSQKIGVSAEALQELGFAAKLNSSNIDDVADALKKLGKNIDEALITKKGPAADALKRLKISLNDPAIKGRDLDKALMEIADRMSDLPDGPKKIALAMDLFGKAGADLIPTLNQGADGLKELRQEAKELGIVLDNKAVGALDDLGDNVDRLKMTLGGLKNQAVAALTPLLSEMAERTLAWVRANRDLIKSSIEKFVNGVATAIGYLGSAISVVVDVIKFFQDHMELTKALLTALTIVFGALAVEAAAAWIAAAAPVVLVIAAITGIVYGIKKLINWIKTSDSVWARAIRAIFSKVRDVAVWLYTKAKAIGGWFVDTARDIKDAFEKAFNWVIKKAGEVSDTIQNLPVIKQAIELGHKIGQATNPDAFISDELAAARDSLKRLDLTQEELNSMRAQNLAQRGINVPQMNAPIRPTGSSPTTITIQNNVTSPNADPKVVADQVTKGFEDQWQQKMRHFVGDFGGAR